MTFSNFILEQSISNASVDDIFIQEAFAELEVSSALMDCYVKSNIITEYAVSDDYSDYGLYMEASETKTDNKTKSDKKSFTEKIGNLAPVRFIKSIIDLIVTAISNFIAKMANKKLLNALIERTAHWDDDMIISDRHRLDIGTVKKLHYGENALNAVMNALKYDHTTNYSIIADKYYRDIKSVDESWNGNKRVNRTSVKEIHDFLVEFRDSKTAEKTHSLLKELKKSEREMLKRVGSEGKESFKSGENHKILKKLITDISNNYIKITKDFLDICKPILDGAKNIKNTPDTFDDADERGGAQSTGGKAADKALSDIEVKPERYRDNAQEPLSVTAAKKRKADMQKALPKSNRTYDDYEEKGSTSDRYFNKLITGQY